MDETKRIVKSFHENGFRVYSDGSFQESRPDGKWVNGYTTYLREDNTMVLEVVVEHDGSLDGKLAAVDHIRRLAKQF